MGSGWQNYSIVGCAKLLQLLQFHYPLPIILLTNWHFLIRYCWTIKSYVLGVLLHKTPITFLENLQIDIIYTLCILVFWLWDSFTNYEVKCLGWTCRVLNLSYSFSFSMLISIILLIHNFLGENLNLIPPMLDILFNYLF